MWFKILLSIYIACATIDRIKLNNQTVTVRINKDPFYVIKKKIPHKRKISNIVTAVESMIFIGGIWYFL